MCSPRFSAAMKEIGARGNSLNIDYMREREVEEDEILGSLSCYSHE